MKGDFEKAVKKMEKQLTENFPNSTIALPGLSIKVGLSKCKEYGIKLTQKE